MSTLVNILLLVIVVALVGYPLMRKEQEQTFVEVKPTKGKSASEQKEIIMNTLGEIEFDYQMKKLSHEDYQSLKQTYSGAAVALMKAEDEVPVKGSGKARLKNKQKAPVAVATSDIEKEIEADLAAMETAPQSGFCHRCGTRLKEDKQEYCHSCGERQF